MESRADRVLELLEAELGGTPNLDHSRLVATLMKRCARREGDDEGAWELAGLLHDLDTFRTEADMSRHGIESSEMLDGLVSKEIREAIASHDKRSGLVPRSKMAIYLILSDVMVNTTNRVPLSELSGHGEKGSAYEAFSSYFKDDGPMRDGLKTVDLYAPKVGMTLPQLCEAVTAVRRA